VGVERLFDHVVDVRRANCLMPHGGPGGLCFTFPPTHVQTARRDNACDVVTAGIV
jgi:hypothetical protein